MLNSNFYFLIVDLVNRIWFVCICMRVKIVLNLKMFFLIFIVKNKLFGRDNIYFILYNKFLVLYSYVFNIYKYKNFLIICIYTFYLIVNICIKDWCFKKMKNY